MEWQREQHTISTDKSRLDVGLIHHRLRAKGTSRLSGDGELAQSSFLWYK